MQRVEDPKTWRAELDRPIGGGPSEIELEQDAESFRAFAAAFGAKPPS